MRSHIAHDVSSGFSVVNDAMNSPIGQVVMDLGGEIPGPVGTCFHVAAAADDLYVIMAALQ